MYSNAQYVDPSNAIIRCDINGVWSCVPCVPGNTDYARIMELVVANELTIAAFVPPPPMPVTQITMRQCRLQLLASGLLDEVEALIAQAERVVQIEWEYATVVDRDSILVAAIASELALSDAAVDGLFEAAATR